MKILKIWKGGKNSEDISKSGNFSRKKHCCYDNGFYTLSRNLNIVDMENEICC